MSTETACLLFGSCASFFWISGLRKGVMLGRSGWIRREDDTFLFWVHALFGGSVALGLIVMPLLAWLGLRE
jgi:hypothetical protein